MSGSCTVDAGIGTLFKRAGSGDDTLDKFLNLVQSPFKQSFTTDAFLASLGSSLGLSALIFIIWCFIRPYHSLVYAPKLRHADEKHAPPRLGKGVFSWLNPLIKCHEDDMVDKIGMDATMFLRFLRLLRTLFFWIGLLGCLIMIPVNVKCNQQNEANFTNAGTNFNEQWYVMISPTYTWGKCMWAHVIIAYAFNFIIMFFLWRNYREVVGLRRKYFESPDYLSSIAGRTLMVTDVPSSYRSDAGLNKIVGGLSVPKHGDEKFAIGRNVKELPRLIEKHNMIVRRVEEVLAKYLKHPDSLPAQRPTCYPDKDDKSMAKGVKVDAIEYNKNRIDEIAHQIYEIRRSIDKRDAMPYGFVSFPTVSRGHIAAKATRGKHPKGTTIKLAPQPRDIIWKNMEKTKAARKWNSFWGNVAFGLLSFLYVIPNALIAVFLSNLNNVALIWDEFNTYLSLHRQGFALVQGFLAPTVTSLIYLMLPIIMRRISAFQGDLTKTSRERHVAAKLYFFFIINNLIIFTLFGTLWTLIQTIIQTAYTTGVNWDTIQNLSIGDRIAVAIFDVSGFWITYLLQRNLGAMLDLAQVVSLLGRSFAMRFLHPTPRQRIEWTAPPPFDYATYYNYFLFYFTIALCFATIQPLVLPIAFMYFGIDSFLKKYLLMYIYVSKTESGGLFWRLLFNRMLFGTMLFNLVVALIVWSRYVWQTAVCVFPLFGILIAFKIYCKHAYDDKVRYFTRGSDRDSMIVSGQFKKKENLEARYGHPALHDPLIKPMVAGKAAHLLEQVYGGATDSETGTKARGDIMMDSMQKGMRGKKKAPPAGLVEVVNEDEMDFAHFKHRAEFGEDHGAGILYADSDGGSTRGTRTIASSSRPTSPTSFVGQQGQHAHGPSPLGMGGMGSYRGAEYGPVPNPAFASPLGTPRPESPYAPDFDFGLTDHRSETESLRPLMQGGQQVGRSATPEGYVSREFGMNMGGPVAAGYSRSSLSGQGKGSYEEYRGVQR